MAEDVGFMYIRRQGVRMCAFRKIDGTNLGIASAPITGSAGLMTVTQAINDGDGTTSYTGAVSQMNHLIHSSSFKPPILLACADCKKLDTPTNNDEECLNGAFRLIKHGNKIAQQKGVKILHDLVRNSKLDDTILAAARILASNPDKSIKEIGIKALLELASDTEMTEDIRVPAAIVLARFGNEATKQKAITILLKIASDSSKFELERLNAAVYVARYGDKSSKIEGIKALRDLLVKGKDALARFEAASFILESGDESAREDAIKILSELANVAREEDIIRLKAADRLINHGNETLKNEAMNALSDLAANAKSDDERYGAAFRLLRYGDSAKKKIGVDVLRKLMKGASDENIGFKSAHGLMKFGDEAAKKEGLNYLISAASNEAEFGEVRIEAALYLISSDNETAKTEGIKTLRTLAMNSKDKQVRKWARRELESLGIKLDMPVQKKKTINEIK